MKATEDKVRQVEALGRMYEQLEITLRETARIEKMEICEKQMKSIMAEIKALI